jgi:hypothetical protein
LAKRSLDMQKMRYIGNTPKLRKRVLLRHGINRKSHQYGV